MKFIRWEALAVANNEVAASISKWALFVVPVLASAVDFVQRNYALHISIPASFFISYCAALSYFIGTLVFKVFCPSDVKQYRNLRAMVEDVQQRLQKSADTPDLAQGAKRGASASSPEELVGHALNEVAPDVLIEELTEKWDNENSSKKNIRICVAALFLLTLLLVAYLSLVDAPRRVYRIAI